MRCARVLLATTLMAVPALPAEQTPFDMTTEQASRPTLEQTEMPLPQAAAVETNARSPFRRHLAPFASIRLEGEIDRRSWSVYLTPEQAASPATLTLAYSNAIVVAPEASRLTIAINGAMVVEQAIARPDETPPQVVPMPAHVLKPGLNRIEIAATQRHRTDCAIDSTYELWTQIDPSNLFLTFANTGTSDLHRIDDLRAIGVDGTGSTRFRLVIPALERPGTAPAILRLAQELALLANMPGQSFDVTDTLGDESRSGSMTVVAGTHAELEEILHDPVKGPETIPGLGIVRDPASGATMLILTGPTWPSILSTLGDLGTRAAGPSTDARKTLPTEMWQAHETRLVTQETDIPLSQLGVPTQDFSGRRFRTEFTLAVPSDFYADAYGQMRILLDAAYSADVLPGSHIDIYVNGHIASTLPITSTGGAILRQLPIKVTTRHFRPGVNRVALEATLLTASDTVCAPGATAASTPRFAIFDTSRIDIPDFARIARSPDLAALAGAGFPYDRSAAIPVLIDRIDGDRLSAAATFAAKLAVAAGRVLPLDVVSSIDTIGDRSALFVGTIAGMPQSVLAQLGIALESRTNWTRAEGVRTAGDGAGSTIDAWRDRMGNGGWYGDLAAVRHWVRGKFDLSLGSLRFVPSRDEAYAPPPEASLLVAQETSPDGSGTWTLLAAPDAARLHSGTDALSLRPMWDQLDGHAVVYREAEQALDIEPVGNVTFVPTTPLSLSNVRLIAANWLSENVLSYAMLLGLFSILIAGATAALLQSLGRK